jgi:VIT1/CCC1 family predicted Fe2+/Mn2+ transporter
VHRLRRLARRLLASLTASIGDVAFGMEDGAVSIAGLVFGVAASTNDSRIVVLAGATGAVAGAVSMMAGTYLDVESEQRRTAALVSRVRERVATDPDRARRRVAHRLQRDGFTGAEQAAVLAAYSRNPEAMVADIAAYELGAAPSARPASPSTHAAWMFVADLFAAGVPVMPFVVFDIATARVVSLVLTGALMAALGVARARIAHEPPFRTALQTMAIAGAAALAGVLIGRLVTS